MLLGLKRSLTTSADAEDGLISLDVEVFLKICSVHVGQITNRNIEESSVNLRHELWSDFTLLMLLWGSDIDHDGIVSTFIFVESVDEGAGVTVGDDVLEVRN